MKTEKLEKQTLTWFVFSANVIVGAMVEKPRDFDPFGQTGLLPLATI